jgi:hypothetical protein
MCMYKEILTLNMFKAPFLMAFTKKYNQDNCVAECKFWEAAHKLNCIPWNYPHLERKKGQKSKPFCDYQASSDFEEAVRSVV